MAHHFPSPYRTRKLAAATPRAAHAAGFALLSEWEAEYQRLRTTGTGAMTTISDEEVKWLTAQMVHESLSADQLARELVDYRDDGLYERSKWRIAFLKKRLRRGTAGEKSGSLKPLHWNGCGRKVTTYQGAPRSIPRSS